MPKPVQKYLPFLISCQISTSIICFGKALISAVFYHLSMTSPIELFGSIFSILSLLSEYVWGGHIKVSTVSHCKMVTFIKFHHIHCYFYLRENSKIYIQFLSRLMKRKMPYVWIWSYCSEIFFIYFYQYFDTVNIVSNKKKILVFSFRKKVNECWDIHVSLHCLKHFFIILDRRNYISYQNW